MDLVTKPRLEMVDRERIFSTLHARMERLLFQNPFPVSDTYEFALSLFPVDVRESWRRLYKYDRYVLDKTSTFDFLVGETAFTLIPHAKHTVRWGISMTPGFPNTKVPVPLPPDSRFAEVVLKWAADQVRVEKRILGCLKTLKTIIIGCNTVGQWHRVAPELVAFLPDQYKMHLQHYTKRVPYPEYIRDLTPEEIRDLKNTLAMAGLLPLHEAEEEYLRGRASAYNGYGYALKKRSWTSGYLSSEHRKLR